MRYFLLGAAALALTACGQPRLPDSAADVTGPVAGVGFGDYEDYAARRDAERTDPALRAAREALDDDADFATQQNSGVPPVEASPSNPAPQVVSNAAGLSAENDFDAVSDQRDIDDDAALIARNRDRYRVIEPTDLPVRPGSGRPNIVEYALRTDNPVGQPLYRRLGLNMQARNARNCAEFTSADLAQEAFLANGGPERDRRALDPDGDGFACGWDPAPFRAVRGG